MNTPSTEKEKLFFKLASEVLNKFDSRTYKEVEEFCKYLKEVAKIATIQMRGIESYVSEDKFYKERLEEYKIIKK